MPGTHRNPACQVNSQCFHSFVEDTELGQKLRYHMRIWGWFKANGFPCFLGVEHPYIPAILVWTTTRYQGELSHISQWDQDFLSFTSLQFPLKNHSGQTIIKYYEYQRVNSFFGHIFSMLRLRCRVVVERHHFRTCQKHRSIARPATCTSSPRMCRWVRGPRPQPRPSPRLQRPRPALRRKVPRRKTMKRSKRLDGPKAMGTSSFLLQNLEILHRKQHLTFEPTRGGDAIPPEIAGSYFLNGPNTPVDSSQNGTCRGWEDERIRAGTRPSHCLMDTHLHPYSTRRPEQTWTEHDTFTKKFEEICFSIVRAERS